MKGSGTGLDVFSLPDGAVLSNDHEITSLCRRRGAVMLVGMSTPKALVVFNPGPAAVNCAVSRQGLRRLLRRKNWPVRVRAAAAYRAH